ncbi:hypothetical protein TNCV_1882071 [Trichonephila clavipes]|nr:hypothetical protein TNCV_1882071 [Trichonephila clavipes]
MDVCKRIVSVRQGEKSKKPSSLKSSREVGRRRREVGDPNSTVACMVLKAKDYDRSTSLTLCRDEFHRPRSDTVRQACVACNSERIGTLPWTSPDTSSMIVRTQLKAGFIAKHYRSPVRMIPI